MKSFILSSEQVSKNFDFSPEYWISNSLLDDNGSSLLDFVDIVNKATSEQEGKYIILDTTHTNNGLLLIQSMDINNPIERKSSKKEVNEGDILISRLRPYLKKISFIPYGIKEKLNIENIYCSTEYFILRPKSSLSSIAFLVPWLLSESIQNIFSNAANGGHHPRLDINLLKSLFIPKNYISTELSNKVEHLTTQHLDAQISMMNLFKSSNNLDNFL